MEISNPQLPEQLFTQMQLLLQAHDNDPGAHGAGAALMALAADLSALSLRLRYPVMSDSFARADGAAAGTSTALTPITTVTGTWRNATFTAAPANVVSGAMKSSNGGAAILLTDVTGHQTSGVTTITMLGTIGTGDVWLYAAFSEGTPSGVVLQRGSDRIRVGTQLGGTITWAQEVLVSNPVRAERITLLLNATTNTATVVLDTVVLMSGVALASNTRGASLGVRASGTATIDDVLVLREVLL